MENIFIDTSIFVKENYLHGTRIRSLLKLCQDKHFRLVLSTITVEEIKANFKREAKEAVARHNELINDKQNILSVLKNNTHSKQLLKKFPNAIQVTHDFNIELDEALAKADALILPYPTLNISGIFDDYFNGRYPFNTSNKKNEFPDAFAMASLEDWCKANGERCTVFSKDKDFLKRTSEHFTVREDFELFFNSYLKLYAPARLDLLASLFASQSDSIDSKIKHWVFNQLDDFTRYYEHTNYFEVHDVEIPEIEVLDKSYEIVGIDNESIQIEVSAEVHVKVLLTIDDEESGIYDSDDKEMIYMDTEELTIERSDLRISSLIKFYIVDEDDYDEDFEVEEINEGKELELPVESWDY